jgi:hypothetical protein
MQVKDIEVEKLIPYVNNPRRNDEAVDYVAASIKEFGFKVPVVIDKENVIVAGHTRVKAAKKLGLESVPCVIADDLTENQIKAFRLADNKVGELATWDFEKLELELQALDLDMVSFGFEEDEEKKEIERKRKEFAERLAAGEIREEDEEYQAFLEKFEPKKTTDDCFTPPKVYAAVVKYVEKMYGVKERDIVRPFYPGGDYQNEKYPKGVVVVDNPPFSILAEILKFYDVKKISFFLFAPALTLFSSSSSSTALCAGASIIYENGASVNTSFLTNLGDRTVRFKSAPVLRKMIDDAMEQTLKETRKTQAKYSYPLNVVTSPMVSQYSRYGIDFSVGIDESIGISELDAQKAAKKAIYGKGYLISTAKKAEREKAEREKAEREKAEREKAEREKAERWELSEREIKLIKSMDRNAALLKEKE